MHRRRPVLTVLALVAGATAAPAPASASTVWEVTSRSASAECAPSDLRGCEATSRPTAAGRVEVRAHVHDHDDVQTATWPVDRTSNRAQAEGTVVTTLRAARAVPSLTVRVTVRTDAATAEYARDHPFFTGGAAYARLTQVLTLHCRDVACAGERSDASAAVWRTEWPEVVGSKSASLPTGERVVELTVSPVGQPKLPAGTTVALSLSGSCEAALSTTTGEATCTNDATVTGVEVVA